MPRAFFPSFQSATLPAPVPAQGRYPRNPSARVPVRWFLPLFFVIGYALTFSSFPFHREDYLLLTAITIVSSLILVTRLNLPLKFTLPTWIILAIFAVGYYLQFYWMTLDPLIYPGFLGFTTQAASSTGALMDAFTTTTFAFATFCVCAWLALPRKLYPPAAAEALRSFAAARDASACRLLIVLIPVVELTTAYVSWTTGVSVMGADPVYLPFRLAGFLYYARVVVLPMLLLLLLWLADRARLRMYFWLGLAMLSAHAAADTLLRSTRASVLFNLLSAAFLFILTDRPVRRALRFAVIAVALGIIFLPATTMYRSLRLAGGSSEIRLFGEGFSRAYSSPLGDVVTESAEMLIFRVTGLNMLVVVTASGTRPLGLGQAYTSSEFFNRAILGVPRHANVGFAPSLVGWLYLVGGNGSVVFGMLAFVLLVEASWRRLWSARLQTRPVAQILFLVTLLAVATDGVVETVHLAVLASVASIVAAELLLPRAVQPNFSLSSKFARRELQGSHASEAAQADPGSA